MLKHYDMLGTELYLLPKINEDAGEDEPHNIQELRQAQDPGGRDAVGKCTYETTCNGLAVEVGTLRPRYINALGH